MDSLSMDQLKEELDRLFPDEEAKTVAVEEGNLAQVGKLLLSAQDDAVVVRLTEVVGDLARVEENRERLGAIEGLLERLVANLKRAEDVPMQKWTARALGNLSYEHESNIEKIVAAGAIQRLIELMRSSDVDVKRNSTGALANLASANDYKEQIVAAGVIPVVYDVLRSSDNEVVQQMAGRVIVNLAENENNQVEMVKAGGLKLLTEFLIKNEDENITLEAIEALTSILEKRDFIAEFVKEGGLKALVPLIADESESTQTAAGGLVYALAAQESLKPFFLAEGLISPLIKLMQSEDAATRKHSIKIVSQLVLNDEVANHVFSDMEQLLGLLQMDDVDILISATMIVGNIARTDEHCLKLVDAGVARSLAKIVQSKDSRLQQLAAGALRNLSIPPQNKRKVAESGVFPGLVACLSSTNAHAMFAAIGAIKTLITLKENRQHFVEHEGLKALIRIKDAIIIDASQPSEETDPEKKPKDLRIQYEAARTLAILTEEEFARDEIVQNQGVGLLNFLFESPFEILQVEGTRALKNLASKEEHRDALVKDGLLDALLVYLTKTKSEQVILGLLGLLSELADNDAYRTQLAAKNADSVLATLTNSPAQTEASHNLRAKIGSSSTSS